MCLQGKYTYLVLSQRCFEREKYIYNKTSLKYTFSWRKNIYGRKFVVEILEKVSNTRILYHRYIISASFGILSIFRMRKNA